ncbi:hypothetical protein BH23BAC3_BH23BAC3_18560 [soil metagenome]
MNRFFKTIPWILLLIFSAGTVFAQTADTDRIERDMRIAEGILAELFDVKDTGFTIRGGNVRSVTGEYIADYGVHFKIGASLIPQTMRVIIRGHAQIERAEDQDSDEDNGIDIEFVQERFMEYFRDYASLIRGLPDREVIRLTFGANTSARTVLTFPSGAARQQQNVPTMTAWATVADINSYSDGSLSEDDFDNRVQIRNLENKETQRDQEVFSSILETALNQAGADNFRVRRNPQADYLPGLGLNYQIHISLRSGSFFGDLNIDGLEFKIDSLAIGLSNLGEHLMPMAVKLDSLFNPHRRNASTDSAVRVYRDSLRNSAQSIRRNLDEEQLSDDEIQEEISKLHTELRQTVIEYGSTLRSLQDDEMLMITLNWSGRHPALPQRSELRIRKADLLNGEEPEITRVERN